MDIDKIPLLEILMDRISDQRADPEHGLKRVGSGTQMRDGPEIFKTVALFLKRIIRSRRPLHRDLRGLNLKRLLRLRRSHQSARNNKSRPYIEPADLIKIIHSIMINNLKRFKIRPVAQNHKSKRLRIPDTADPSPHRHLLIQKLTPVSIYFSHSH